jgi:hypothetical protein
MEPAQVALLQDILRRESRSLLQYVAESYPWSKREGAAACAAIRSMARAEADVVARLGRWLAKERVAVTFPGAYPMQFTTMNFVAVSFLLPRLAEEERTRIAELQHSLNAIPDGARALVQTLIDLKGRHAEQLAALGKPTSPSALAS